MAGTALHLFNKKLFDGLHPFKNVGERFGYAAYRIMDATNPGNRIRLKAIEEWPE
jgi:hypothetical protein